LRVLTNAQRSAICRTLKNNADISNADLGRRFNVSASTIDRYRHYDVLYPKGHRNRAVQLGLTEEEYAEKLAKNLRHCQKCLKWVPLDVAYNEDRKSCRACIRWYGTLSREEKDEHLKKSRKVRAARKLRINRMKAGKVIALIENNGAMETGAICRHLSLHATTFRPTLQWMEKEGIIVRSGRKWQVNETHGEQRQ